MNAIEAKRLELYKCFEQCVKKHFEFLKYMSCVVNKTRSGWSVYYSSKVVSVGIHYERLSFEIDATILLKRENISCYVGEIINPSYSRKFLAATNEDVIELAIVELKEIIQHHCSQFVNGDAGAFKRILNRRAEFGKRYKIMQIEDKAISAWRNKNYRKVVKLYTLIEDTLTPIQEKRMNLSMKMIADSVDKLDN